MIDYKEGKLSDLTSMDEMVRDTVLQSLSATRMASASHGVFKAGSPRAAWNRVKSAADRPSANHLEGAPLADKTPPMPHGDAYADMARSA